MEERSKEYKKNAMGNYIFKISTNRYVDATKCGSLARYINHSCSPNCKSKVVKVNNEPKIVIYAVKNIAEGVELTFDYCFDRSKVEERIICKCKSAKCRGFIDL